MKALVRPTLLLALALDGLVARIPGFHTGYPGPILGQATKILLQATTHCCLTKISYSLRIAELCSKILRTCAVIHLLVPAKVPHSIPHQHGHLKHHWPKWQSSLHGKCRVHSKLAVFWVIQQMDQSSTPREGICLQNPKRCFAFVLVREGARCDNPSFLHLRINISTCPHIMTPRNFTEVIGP